MDTADQQLPEKEVKALSREPVGADAGQTEQENKPPLQEQPVLKSSNLVTSWAPAGVALLFLCWGPPPDESVCGTRCAGEGISTLLHPRPGRPALPPATRLLANAGEPPPAQAGTSAKQVRTLQAGRSGCTCKH